MVSAQVQPPRDVASCLLFFDSGSKREKTQSFMKAIERSLWSPSDTHVHTRTNRETSIDDRACILKQPCRLVVALVEHIRTCFSARLPWYLALSSRLRFFEAETKFAEEHSCHPTRLLSGPQHVDTAGGGPVRDVS